jgi:MFS family permease
MHEIRLKAHLQDRFPSISLDGGNSTLQGFVVAVYEIGCAIGALSVISGGDQYGRRVTVMCDQTILIIGAILRFTSYSLAQLIVGRIVSKCFCFAICIRVSPLDLC